MERSRKTRWAAAAIVIIALVAITLFQTPWVRDNLQYYRAEKLGCPVEFLDPGIDELSGVAYHPMRHTLLVDSDQGQLAEMDGDYRILTQYDIPGDIEAVAVHPATGTVFVTSERDGAIIEYDLSLRRALRTMRVDFASHVEFRGGMVENKGLEGVAVVTDGSNTCRLVAAVEARPARLIELSADVSPERTEQLRATEDGDPLVGVQEETAILASHDPGISRISDILFDPELRAILVVSSTERTLTICDLQGHPLRAFRLPGKKPEGLCFLPSGDGIVVQDTGGMWIVKGLRAALVPAREPGPVPASQP